jgi:hypothetical protein
MVAHPGALAGAGAGEQERLAPGGEWARRRPAYTARRNPVAGGDALAPFEVHERGGQELRRVPPVASMIDMVEY